MSNIKDTKTSDGWIKCITTRSGILVMFTEDGSGRYQGSLPMTWKDVEVLHAFLGEAIKERQPTKIIKTNEELQEYLNKICPMCGGGDE